MAEQVVSCDECGTPLTVPYSWAREGKGEQPSLCKPCWDTLFEKKYGHKYEPYAAKKDV